MIYTQLLHNRKCRMSQARLPWRRCDKRHPSRAKVPDFLACPWVFQLFSTDSPLS
jgi:hypothetical protein